MSRNELQLYKHLKEQAAILDRQIATLQELRQKTEQDLKRLEEQQKERSQLDLFR